eukprot:6099650-Prymnesium_polylepis.3
MCLTARLTSSRPDSGDHSSGPDCSSGRRFVMCPMETSTTLAAGAAARVERYTMRASSASAALRMRDSGKCSIMSSMNHPLP